jgi:2,4-dienoyl-CoA reductase-like NADH-dependent reductase (Old Yellow Enzyme family)
VNISDSAIFTDIHDREGGTSRTSTGPASDPLASSLTLRSGGVLTNRFVKAAMSEGLAEGHAPSEAMIRLYTQWGAEGSLAALITGNIQVDRNHLERAANLVLDDRHAYSEHRRFERLTGVAQQHGSLLLAQLSHAGRATVASLNPRPLAPSAVQLKVPGATFGMPQTMSACEIDTVVQQFVTAARLAREMGFGGIEVHAAHGYLLSQFLSPRSNLRTDQWGGSLENRARLLLDVVRAVRTVGFVLGVKLNASDFQRGGFSLDEAVQVARWLDEAGVDFLEITGGTYEHPVMAGKAAPTFSTDSNALHVDAGLSYEEAFFSRYSAEIKRSVRCAVMATGGFRSRVAMEHAVTSGAADLLGVGRPLCIDPGCVRDLLSGVRSSLPARERELALSSLATLGPDSRWPLVRRLTVWGSLNWFSVQMLRLSSIGASDPSLSLVRALYEYALWERADTRRRTMRASEKNHSNGETK